MTEPFTKPHSFSSQFFFSKHPGTFLPPELKSTCNSQINIRGTNQYYYYIFRGHGLSLLAILPNTATTPSTPNNPNPENHCDWLPPCKDSGQTLPLTHDLPPYERQSPSLEVAAPNRIKNRDSIHVDTRKSTTDNKTLPLSPVIPLYTMNCVIYPVYNEINDSPYYANKPDNSDVQRVCGVTLNFFLPPFWGVFEKWCNWLEKSLPMQVNKDQIASDGSSTKNAPCLVTSLF